MKHPRAADHLERARLVEIAGITRPAREPQLPGDDGRTALFQVGDPAPARQPDQRSLFSRRRIEN